MLTSIRLLQLEQSQVISSSPFSAAPEVQLFGELQHFSSGALLPQLVWSLCMGCSQRTGSPSPSGALLRPGGTNMDIEMKADIRSLPPSRQGNTQHKEFAFSTSYREFTPAQSFCKILFSALEGSDMCLLCFTGVWCPAVNHQIQKCTWAVWATSCLTQLRAQCTGRKQEHSVHAVKAVWREENQLEIRPFISCRLLSGVTKANMPSSCVWLGANNAAAWQKH